MPNQNINVPPQDLIDCMNAQKTLNLQEIQTLNTSITNANNQIDDLNNNIDNINVYISQCNDQISGLNDTNDKIDQIINILENQPLIQNK